MHFKDLLRYRNEVPFEPFRLITSDGSAYDVVSPEWFQVGVHQSYLSIPSLEYPEAVDYIVRIANDQITHTWPLAAARERGNRDQAG